MRAAAHTVPQRRQQTGRAVWRTADVLTDRSWEITLDDQQRVRAWFYPAALARGYDLAVLTPPVALMMTPACSWVCSTQLMSARAFMMPE